MDWDKGYSARYYISILDKDTLRDIDRIELTGGSIKRTSTDLRESADLDCVDYNTNQEQYIRVWLDAKQDGGSSHTPLFTGIATSPGRDINGRYVTNSLECYSLLKIAQDILLPRGWYAPAEMSGESLLRMLLEPVKAKLDIAENAPSLSQAIIAEDGENNLSMIDKILSAINWRMKLDGYGNIIIGPEAYMIDQRDDSIVVRSLSGRFGALDNDILEPSLTITYDWFGCPNVFRAVMDDSAAVARDEDEKSVYSIKNRGREIWAEETDCQLNDNETLAEYAFRRLKELQRVSTNISYDRRYMPDIYPSDIVELNYPAQNIQGNYYITSQSITLGYNAKTSEEVIEI